MDPLIFYSSLTGLWILAFGSGLVLLFGTAAKAGKLARARRP